MLALTALLSLAAFVSADQTFSLVGRGDHFDYNLLIADGVLGFLNDGEIGSFLLHEPSGYLEAQGKEVIVGVETLYLSSDDHSKDFGVTDGKLRFNTQGTEFFACPLDTGYKLSSSQCDRGFPISLYLAGAASDPNSVPASSATSTTSSAPAPSAPASSPAPAANGTVVHSHSTLVTITSCAEGVECTPAPAPTVSSYEAGAAQAGLAAGAVALAGAMLL